MKLIGFTAAAAVVIELIGMHDDALKGKLMGIMNRVVVRSCFLQYLQGKGVIGNIGVDGRTEKRGDVVSGATRGLSCYYTAEQAPPRP